MLNDAAITLSQVFIRDESLYRNASGGSLGVVDETVLDIVDGVAVALD